MASMRDIAREAGVCVATVSRILSADAGFKVSDETRERVLSTAVRLGYPVKITEPKKGKLQFGCVLAMTAETYGDPYFSAILAAAEEECSRQGAVISYLCNHTDLQKPDFLEMFLTQELDGLFLMDSVSPSILRRIRERFPHIVSIDEEISEVNVVGYDRLSANLQVMNCLLERGYRRIALISGSSADRPMSEGIRLLVYREALRREGIAYDPALVKDCGWNMALCAAQTQELMRMKDPPDVIFAGSDSLASSILSTLYSMGYRCPKDVGVIGFNNIPLSAHMIPALTTIELPTEQMGRCAVQQLTAMIRNQNHPVQKVLFPTRLVERRSLREIPE